MFELQIMIILLLLTNMWLLYFLITRLKKIIKKLGLNKKVKKKTRVILPKLISFKFES